MIGNIKLEMDGLIVDAQYQVVDRIIISLSYKMNGKYIDISERLCDEALYDELKVHADNMRELH